MADINQGPIPDYGSLLSSYPSALANQSAQSAYAAHTNASIPLVQQQAIGANLNNQKSAMELQFLRNFMSQQQIQDNGPQSDNSGDMISPTEQGISSSLNARYGFVDPNGPPALQQQIMRAAQLATVLPGAAEMAKVLQAQRDKIVQGQMLRNAAETNQLFEGGMLAYKSDQPLEVLSHLPVDYARNVAAAIRQQYGVGPDGAGTPEAEAAARNAANYIARYSHEYTGRPVKQYGDEIRDEVSQFTLHGVSKVGATPGENIELSKFLKSPQTITKDNRETTIIPWNEGIHSYSDLMKAQKGGMQFRNLPPFAQPQGAENQNQPASAGSAGMQPPIARPPITQAAPNPALQPVAPTGQRIGPGGAQTQQAPAGVAGASASAQNPSAVQAGQSGIVPPLPNDQQQFLRSMQDGMAKPPSNEKLNQQDQNTWDTENGQRKALATTVNKELYRASNELQSVSRLTRIINNPQLAYTGPGSETRAEADTALANYFHNAPAEVRAAAYQIAAKVLNQNQMNGILEQFHAEGAQVRLGAYESRLIMTALAANPSMTRTAINQLLQWGASDAQYDQTKYRTMSQAIHSNKNVATAEGDYDTAFPRKDLTITGLSAFYNFGGAKGKTYSQSEVSQAAKRAGYPDNVFAKELQAAGATIK